MSSPQGVTDRLDVSRELWEKSNWRSSGDITAPIKFPKIVTTLEQLLV